MGFPRRPLSGNLVNRGNSSPLTTSQNPTVYHEGWLNPVQSHPSLKWKPNALSFIERCVLCLWLTLYPYIVNIYLIILLTSS